MYVLKYSLRTLFAVAGVTFAARVSLNLIRGTVGLSDALLTAALVSVVCAPLVYAWVVRDAARQASDAAAERSGRTKFRGLIDAVAEGAVIVDSEGRIRDVNRKSEELFGYDRTELINQPVEILVPERFREAHVGHRRRYMAQPSPVPLGIDRELVARRRNGSEFPMELSLSPMSLDGVDCVLALVTDISERRRIESERALSVAVEKRLSEFIIITDFRGIIRYVNPGFERITGYAREEAIGRNPKILKSGKQAQEFYDQMWATLRAGQVWASRFINRRKDGTLYEQETTITPVTDDSGRITHFVAVGREVPMARQSA